MGSSGNVWVVLRIQQICNTTRHKSPIYGLFALSKRSQRDNDCLRIAMQMESPEEFILQGLFLCIVILRFASNIFAYS